MLPITTEIPDAWMRLLRRLHPHFGVVVLGGGAMRDLLCGRVIKDLDVFVNPAGPGSFDADFLRRELFAEPTLMQPAREDYHCAHEVTDIYSFRWEGEWDAELIICKTPRIRKVADIVGTFDIGLCQIGVDHRGFVVGTDAFYHDLYTDSLTVVADKTPNSTSRRLTRLALADDAKYRGWVVDARLLANLDGLNAPFEPVDHIDDHAKHGPFDEVLGG